MSRIEIDTPELKDVLLRSIDAEPNWLSGDLKNYPGTRKMDIPVQTEGDEKSLPPIQQGDLLRPLLMDILNFGLPYAYAKYKCLPSEDPEPFKCAQTNNPKTVIIVGAGIAGLCAGFELQRAGHKVQILEMQLRVGGRIKTFTEKQGFAKGLYVEGGAMRLPSKPDDDNKIHYLTDSYIKKFGLSVGPFNNSDDDALLKFYNDPAVTLTKWNDNSEENFSRLWPNWNKNIKGKFSKIDSIDKYYQATTGVVTTILRRRLIKAKTCVGKAQAWNDWIKDWSQFGLDTFLRSTYELLVKMVKSATEDELKPLMNLLPWPEAAINAYKVFTYTSELDNSMITFLREDLGQWWTPDMHHILGGMSKLPHAFLEKQKDSCGRTSDLYPNITLNTIVREVKYTSVKGNNKVQVTGTYTTSGRTFCVEGDAIIITTPLNIIREIRIIPDGDTSTPPFPKEFQQIIENINYAPSTKIMIQSKCRFWEAMNITGGFSKTNRPIGQLHYPTNTKEYPIPGDKGILLCYTWKSEALMFGSMPHDLAIEEAVREIAEIHPEINCNFEVGAVQAWYSEPSSQGAYVSFKPMQYYNVLFLFLLPWHNIYFAGEGISFANGWIQGALQSALRAAYQFYARNEKEAEPN